MRPVKPWNAFTIPVLLLADFATKSVLTTKPWAEDYKSLTAVPSNPLPNPYHSSLLLTLLTLIVLAVIFVPFRVPLILPVLLTVAGGLGNILSMVTGDYVPNPFVAVYNDYQIGFNLADVYLVLGAVLMVTVLLDRCITHASVLYYERGRTN